MKRVWIWVISVFALLALLIIAYLIYRKTLVTTDPEIDRVIVIDGDTFRYYDEYNVYRTVRLLCVDTPEEGEEGYQEAKDFLESLIDDNPFAMIDSNYSNQEDEYGRLLMWIYIDNGNGEQIFVNKLIVDNGYGEVFVVPPETCQEIL